MDNNTLKIQVTVAGADQAKSSLQGVQNQVKASSSSITGDVFKANLAFEALKVGVGVAVDGVKMFASTAASVISNSVKMADSLQQNRIAFETMLGSADKAKELLTALDKFAVQTPFNLTQLQDLSKQLLAYGVAQKDIIPDLTTLGNIAAGVGMDKLPNLVMAFGQVKTATRLTGMELRQFTEAGVGVVEALQNYYKATGKAVTVTKESSTAQIKNANTIKETTAKLNALKQKYNEIKATGKATKSQLMTMEAQMLSYNNTISEASVQTGGFSKAMDLSSESIKKMVEQGQVSFEDLSAALAMVAGKGGRYDNLMGKQMKTFSGMQSNLEDFKDRFLRTLGGITGTGDIIKGGLLDVLGENLGKVLQLIDEHEPEITAFMKTLSTTIGGNFSEIMKTLGEKIPIIMEKLPGLVKGVTDLKDGLTDIAPKLKPLAEFLGSSILSGIDLGGYAIGTVGNLLSMISARMDGNEKKIEEIKKKQESLGEASIYGIGSNFGFSKEQIDNTLRDMVSGFNLLPGEIAKPFNTIGTNISAKLNEIKTNINNSFSGARDFMVNRMTEAKNSIMDKFGQVKNFFMTDLPNAFQKFISSATSALWSLPNTIKGAFNDLIGKAESAINGLIRAFRSMPFSSWVNEVRINRLEKGTSNYGGGLSTINERGGELIHLPGGSAVTSSGESEALLARAFEKALRNVMGNIGTNVNFNAPISFGGQRGDMQEQNQFVNLLIRGI